MSYKIDPTKYCTEDGCGRPKLSGEELCALCLGRMADAEAGTTSAPSTSPGPSPVPAEPADLTANQGKLPRCVAYLSKDGDVITLELTGEPKFTEADVELVASALSNRRQAA